MTETKTKPREFWIYHSNQRSDVYNAEIKEFNRPADLHVIEYSALTAAEEEVKQLRADLRSKLDMLDIADDVIHKLSNMAPHTDENMDIFYQWIKAKGGDV